MNKTKTLIADFLSAAGEFMDVEAKRLDCIRELVPAAVYYGHNSLGTLPDLIKGYGLEPDAPVLIVTGQGSVKREGYYNRVVSQLQGHAIIDCAGVTPDALVEKVDELIGIIRDRRPGLIISLGGGSAMDAAATAAALANQEAGENQTADILGGGNSVPRRAMRLVAIPTTAGTGSEATSFSVITGADNKKLFSISENYYPDAVLLMPEFLTTVPQSVIGPVAMDAMAHAFEAIISARATPDSDKPALAALYLYNKYFERYYTNSADIEAAAALSLAACLAGTAFDKAFTAACHGLSFPIAEVMGISHGEACAMTLATDVSYNCRRQPERMKMIADLWDIQDVGALPARLQTLMEKTGLRKSIRAHFNAMNPAMTDRVLASLAPYRTMYDNDPAAPADPAPYLKEARCAGLGGPTL